MVLLIVFVLKDEDLDLKKKRMNEMEYFTFGAEQEDVGTRIDVFLADAMENLSRSGVQKLIEEGHITLNGGRTKANYKLRERDIIDVEVPEVKEVEILPEDIPLDILYEDADVIVVNKPQGMVVHPAPGHTSGTLVNALMFHCGNELSGINGEKRPGIVHRIDKDTSGVLMVAKTIWRISLWRHSLQSTALRENIMRWSTTVLRRTRGRWTSLSAEIHRTERKWQ